MDIDSELMPALAERKSQQRYRHRLTLDSSVGVRVVCDDKQYLNFSSNDYLGLANHPDVVRSFQQAADHFGVGSGASHLVCGHSREHHQLEEELAAFTGRDRALLFSTGYAANLGCITALIAKGDAVFEDRLNHASLLDGGLLSGARFQRYHHNDIDDLQKRMVKTNAHRKLIVADGVFSMDGDLAPLDKLATVAGQSSAWLMVDDAHGFGVLGETGAGTAEHFNLTQQQLPILMGTLGKALGTFGAFIAGSDVLIETLIQHARPYIYTTALPPAVAAATRTSLKLVQSESWRREKLQDLLIRFRRGLEAESIPLLPSTTAIQPVMVGDDGQTMALQAELKAAGFLVGAIRPPTVPEGTARLRVTFCAEHTVEQVDQLVEALSKVWKKIMPKQHLDSEGCDV